MDVQLVAEGFEFPEGPIAMDDGSVILTEIKAQRLTRVTPDGKKTTVVETGGGPNGAAIGPDGAIWITNNGGAFEWLDQGGMTIPGPTPASHKGGMLQRFDMKSGKLETVYDACDGRRLIGPNDLVFDKHGGVWFTDHGCSTPEGRKFGALYYAKTDGSYISRQRDHIISPNGVGLSPDEKVVYAADTQLARLWAFDVAEPGVLAPAAGFAPGRVVKNLDGFQFLDSLASAART
jgi:gluconolactonase